ncbi:MAG: F0F1 ATP synthase subunit I [Rhodobacteraceae bacterium]|nr:F0F1 ATP synthase subunit I [Paracoccaceae bacterium]
MSDSPDDKRLSELDEKLRAARKAIEPEAAEEHHVSQAQAGWRMVTELVVGLLMGFGIGYGLDALFGTIPIFLILFTLLGFAAGVRAMMKSAAEIAAKQAETPKE